MKDHETKSAAGTALAERPADKPATTKTILLVDSAPLFLRFEETILARKEWRIRRATTGAAALDMLEREPADLVVMDHLLPDLQGDHVIRAIRSNAAFRKTSILLVTARTDDGVVERCMAEGCNAFLYKPVSRQVLCAKAEQLLDIAARRHVRTLVRLQVNGDGASQCSFGNTVNLSGGGMLVETGVDLAIGQTMDLRFHLPGDPEPIVVMARAVRLDETQGTHGAWGLVFESVSAEDKRRIEGFVQKAQPEGQRAGV
jgi:CheY-like chemotaxis protein